MSFTEPLVDACRKHLVRTRQSLVTLQIIIVSIIEHIRHRVKWYDRVGGAVRRALGLRKISMTRVKGRIFLVRQVEEVGPLHEFEPVRVPVERAPERLTIPWTENPFFARFSRSCTPVKTAPGGFRLPSPRGRLSHPSSRLGRHSISTP